MKKTILTSATLVLAAMAVTGCSSAAPADEAPAPSAASSTAAAAPAAATGDVVAADATLSDTQTAYPMADGTFVAVDKNEPLPDAVLAQVNAEASAIAVQHGDAMATDRSAGLQARGAAKVDFQRDTGKRVIIAWDTVGLPTADTVSPIHFWAIDMPGYPLVVDRAEAEAKIATYLATQDDAASYQVIWATQ